MHVWRFLALLLIVTGITVSGSAAAPELSGTYYTAIYFHGVGCSHCAKVDGPLLSNWLPNTTHLIVIDYDVNQDPANLPALRSLNDSYRTGTGIPILFFSRSAFFRGDTNILAKTPDLLFLFETNQTVREQYATPFRNVTIETLPGHPRIWYQDRVLIRTETGDETATARELLVSRSIPRALENVTYKRVDPVAIRFAALNLTFKNAVEIPGWILQWNASVLPKPVSEAPYGDDLQKSATPQQTSLIYAPVAAILCIAIYCGLRENH